MYLLGAACICSMTLCAQWHVQCRHLPKITFSAHHNHAGYNCEYFNAIIVQLEALERSFKRPHSYIVCQKTICTAAQAVDMLNHPCTNRLTTDFSLSLIHNYQGLSIGLIRQSLSETLHCRL